MNIVFIKLAVSRDQMTKEHVSVIARSSFRPFIRLVFITLNRRLRNTCNRLIEIRSDQSKTLDECFVVGLCIHAIFD